MLARQGEWLGPWVSLELPKGLGDKEMATGLADRRSPCGRPLKITEYRDRRLDCPSAPIAHKGRPFGTYGKIVPIWSGAKRTGLPRGQG